MPRIDLSTLSAPAVALVAAVACGGGGARPTLTGGAESLNALVSEYVAAVASGDTGNMHRLRVTETEHNELLWPAFPAAHPDRNIPIDFVWLNIDRRSRRDAARAAAEWAGQPIELLETTCRRGVTDYKSFRVHGDCWVTLLRVDNSTTRMAKILGSVVEMGGRYKVIGIIAD